MPVFPKREADILVLVQAMMQGYLAHLGDFPSRNIGILISARADYNGAKATQVEAIAQAQVVTDQKDAALAALAEKMKAELKKSEVDVGGDSEKLEYIGWGPKASPSPAAPPGQPRNLEALAQGNGTVDLDWKGPARGSGGPVRTYVIERRDEPEGGEFGDWSQASIALESQAILMTQPRGQQLEYRIRAVNTGGVSIPSNTAPVVL